MPPAVHPERPPLVERVIEWSARNPFLVLALVLLLLAAGWQCLRRTPLDAIPDLSDPQVTVLTGWEGRSPSLLEEQVTAPLVSKLMSTAHARVVRGFSYPGYSYVHVIFAEGTDLYWARSRVQETLASVQAQLPPGVTPSLGPDATGVGWGFQYALVDRSGRQDAADLRSFQDWTLRPWLQSVEGVAEVAVFGGFEKQYQVEVDPVRLEAFGVTLDAVVAAIRGANREVGAREIERNGTMWLVRGRGYLAGLDDLRAVAVAPAGRDGAPVRLGEVARNISLGPEMRRGAGDLDGRGETPGGIVVVRTGENVLRVLDRVKAKLEEVRPALPAGVEVVTTYDRSDLIRGAVRTLSLTLAEEAVIVALVVIVFLLDFGGAARAIVTMPAAVLIAFIPMRLLGLSSNLMSLGGIAIALGAMVDEAVVMVENVHKRLERAPPGLSRAERREVVIAACRQLGKPLFFALLIITVSFLPVFTLESQEGRLFKPLAWTKTLCMAGAALLSVTLGPALMVWMAGARVIPERRHPVSRLLQRLYHPWVSALMRRRALSIALAVAAVGSCVPVFHRLGSEFMPTLNEGDILYMPTTLPTLAIGEAARVMRIMDRELASFPEVLSVHGKAGRAETATDPAPLEMFETLVRLRPRGEWRSVPRPRWYSGWAPEPVAAALRAVWPDRRPLTWDELVAEMDARLRIPGFVNAWTMPIRNRIDMLATGIRTPVGIKIFGRDLAGIERAGALLERVVSRVPGTRSVFAERTATGLYLDVTPDRAALARHGLNAGDVLMALETAAGGMAVERTVEGRERYTVNVRYPRELRDDPERIRAIRVPVMPAAAADGDMAAAPARPALIPLGELARVELVSGPAMIRNEDGGLTGWVYVDVAGRDLGGYVDEARRVVRAEVEDAGLLPPGTQLSWSGQYEYLLRVRDRLRAVVPLTLALIAFLLYLNFRSLPATLIILLSIPFSLTGSVWMVHALGYHLSVAVWIGVIALAGLAAQTGIVMLVYLEEAYHAAVRAGRMRTQHDLFDAITLGAVQRVRPKVMTVLTMTLGLLPLLWSEGPGADVMKRIAAPMVGGLASSALLTLEIIPAIYSIWRGRGVEWVKEKPPRRTWDELCRQAEQP